jgi:hypothetical protein
MTEPRYNLANLVPRSVYATQVRKVLVDLRGELAHWPVGEFEHNGLERLLGDLASRHEIASADLQDILRVVFEWPNRASDLPASMERLGQAGCVGCLDIAVMMLSDVARQ